MVTTEDRGRLKLVIQQAGVLIKGGVKSRETEKAKKTIKEAGARHHLDNFLAQIKTSNIILTRDERGPREPHCVTLNQRRVPQ